MGRLSPRFQFHLPEHWLSGTGPQSWDPFPFLRGLDIPPEWEAAANRFVETTGAVMVLGAPDTGKSTLCRYLVLRAFTAGQRVGLVDLDLGQSHLGPPATLGLDLFPPRRPGDEVLFPAGVYFIGQTSPVGKMLEVSVGCRVLVDQGVSQGCTRVVVNTSGLVQGAGALILKRAQVELLRPTLILGLQREQELEPLLRGLGGDDLQNGPPLTPPPPDGGGAEVFPWQLVRLPVSPQATRKTPEDRRSYREGRFRQYFQGAQRVALPCRGLVWEGLPWGHGDILPPQVLEQIGPSLGAEPLYGESQGRRAVLLLAEAPTAPFPENFPGQDNWDRVLWLTWPSLHYRLVGLLDGLRRTLAMGLILPSVWDPKTLALWSPMVPEALVRVRVVKAGKMRLNLRGQELTHG